MEIKNRIKETRIKKGISTYKLAEIMTKNGFKISQSQISKIENGNKKIDTDTLTNIAKALETSVNNLIGYFGIDLFASYIMNIKGQRTVEEYAHDCGLEPEYILKIVQQKLDEAPNPEIIKKLASGIPEQCGIDYLHLMTITGNMDFDVAENIRREKNNDIPASSTIWSSGAIEDEHQNEIQVTSKKDNELSINVKFFDEPFTQGDINSIIDFISSLHYKKKMKIKYSSLLEKNDKE